MGEIFLMHFILYILTLISCDVAVGFVIFIFYKYFDLKYFSTTEIELLKEENEYLKKEIKKVASKDYTSFTS